MALSAVYAGRTAPAASASSTAAATRHLFFTGISSEGGRSDGQLTGSLGPNRLSTQIWEFENPVGQGMTIGDQMLGGSSDRRWSNYAPADGHLRTAGASNSGHVLNRTTGMARPAVHLACEFRHVELRLSGDRIRHHEP